MDWSVSVTTCQRQGASYLAECLDSICAAGWLDEIRVHEDDGGVLGPWGNLIIAIKAAAECDPDVALFIQDDTLISAHGRAYLEAVLPEQPWWSSFGILSLYVNAATAKKLRSGFSVAPIEVMGQHGGGACAFLMPRHALQAIAKDPPWPKAWHLAEIWLQVYCGANKLAWIDHCPSLAKHIGRVSALKVVPNETMPRPEPPWSEWRHEGSWVDDAAVLMPKPVLSDTTKLAKKMQAETTLF